MHDLCAECNGACCRGVSIRLSGDPLSPDVREWMETRGRVEGSTWHIDAECVYLDAGGRCSRYADRPNNCRAYEPGGADCFKAREVWGERRDG